MKWLIMIVLNPKEICCFRVSLLNGSSLGHGNQDLRVFEWFLQAAKNHFIFELFKVTLLIFLIKEANFNAT